jgi:pimeloyl-ACP methyl ester carboxylesterase
MCLEPLLDDMGGAFRLEINGTMSVKVDEDRTVDLTLCATRLSNLYLKMRLSASMYTRFCGTWRWHSVASSRRSIMRSFELTAEFEKRIIAPLQERPFPAQVLWGLGDPALRIERHGYEALAVLGVKRVQALPGKHFVQEDSPTAIAEAIHTLATQHES